MRFTSSVLASAALLTTANAAIKGFNYGAQFNNDAAKKEVDFEYEFRRAQNLPGTDGWTNARLYTMIQHGTQNTVIEAIQAAINTKTRLLLGLWASAGQESFNNEITALKAAIAQYGTAFTDLVDGISVGSEDLYRVSPDGAGGNPGANPDTLVNYIKQTRDAIAGTSLSGAKLGHVDTWQVYVNASNSAVIDNLDWIGMDSYPYFQSSFANSIGNAPDLFFDSYNQTVAAAKGKPVWVTETAWPVSGETVNQGVPSADNARVYWEDVVCKLVRDNVNLYYYILQDVQYGNPSPSFGIMPGGDLNQVSPLFDLSCPNVSSSPMIPFPMLLLSSALSPLAFAFLAHLSLAAVVLSYFFRTAPSGCSCASPRHQPVHTLAWAAKPQGWVARANVIAKRTLSLPTLSSSSSVDVGNDLSSLAGLIKSPFLTTEPTGVTAPGITSANPVSATLAPSGSPVGNPPLLSNSLSLQGLFEAPNLIVSVDTANPAKVLGNGYVARLSPTLSSVLVFDIHPETQGKICNLAFHMLPPSPWPDMSPVRLRLPGGISVSSVGQQAVSADMGANDVAGSTVIGSVPSVQPDNHYAIASFPCPAGKRVAYQLQSTGGLVMDFFQMTTPALGLFMGVAG